jgi:hypothetical protein
MVGGMVGGFRRLQGLDLDCDLVADFTLKAADEAVGAVDPS